MSQNRSVLDKALNSLTVSAANNKRENTFRVNHDTTTKLWQRDNFKIGQHFSIKPVVNGDADSQHSAPIGSSDTFRIDTSLLKLPAGMNQYGGNLQSLIRTLCDRCNITYDNLNEAIFTAAVPGLPGQFNKDDLDCNDVTQSEFVPAFACRDGVQRAVIASFPVSGNDYLRLDNLLVERGTIACTGHHAGTNANKAYIATEIPNEVAVSLADNSPKQFDQLQRNGCLVVQLTYDFEPYQRHRFVLESAGMGYRSKGGEEAAESSSYQSRSDSGQSVYSVVGTGSSINDNTQTVREDGIRRLKEIRVFAVSPMIINTHEQTLSDAQLANMTSLMQARAAELAKFYLPCRIFKFEDISEQFNEFLHGYQVSTKSDILENSLLRAVGIETEPTRCQILPVRYDSQSMIVRFGLPRETVKQFITLLNDKFGANCTYDSDFITDTAFAVRMKISNLRYDSPLMAAVKEAATKLLSDKRTLNAFQLYTNRVSSSDRHKYAVQTIRNCLSIYNIDLTKTPITEVILARMFGVTEFFDKSEIYNGKGYISAMCDTDFYINISPGAAQLFVDNLNKQFTYVYPLARLVSTNATLDNYNGSLCRIALDKSLFTREDFRQAFKAKAAELNEAEPMMFDDFRAQSNSQRSLLDIQKSLSDCAKKFEAKGDTNIAESLTVLNSALTTKGTTLKNRGDAAFAVSQACRLWKTKHNQTEVQEFKDGEKKEINELMKELRLRK